MGTDRCQLYKYIRPLETTRGQAHTILSYTHPPNPSINYQDPLIEE